MASVTKLYSSIEVQRDRESFRVRERKKTSKKREDCASAIWEQRYVSEPIETKYLKY